MKTASLLTILILSTLTLTSCTRPDNNASEGKSNNKILIAAASDLKFALDSVIAIFRNDYPENIIDVTYGSSGKLFEQIHHDAPFDLFFSADIEYPRLLKSKGLCNSDVKIYGRGRLVIWSSRVDPNEQGINTLSLKSIKKIAIANPRHAPYGKRAVEILEHYGLSDSIGYKIVYGENISQAAQFVTTGAADAGIIALSLAVSPMMQNAGKYYLIPESAHTPLDQGFVILNRADKNDLAATFGKFILEEQATSILRYYGFEKKQ